jgi:hypothetical protein
MTTGITQAFARLYRSEVHEAYQLRGSKLRNCCRTQLVKDAADVYFQKVSAATASTKSRNSLIAVSDVEHTKVLATLQDFYTGAWVDRMDELKVNFSERQVLANAGAWALGRKTDQLLLASLAELAASTTISVASKNAFRNSVLTVLETLNNNDVPDDGQRWGVVSARFWSWLLTIDEFNNSDFIGQEDLPYKGGKFFQIRPWIGVSWLMHSGISGIGSTSSNLLFHKTAAGHAIGQEPTADITWHGDRAAWFVAHSMSQTAVMIDSAGGLKLMLDETANLATS